MTNPVYIWNLIDVMKGVFLSFRLITVNIIINAANHKYNDRLSWRNLEILNSEFIFFLLDNTNLYFLVHRNASQDKGFPVIWK